MSIKKLNPYVNLNGNAGRAIALYEAALGAKTHDLMRFRDVPGMKAPEGQEDRVMHARLEIGEGQIMVTDASPRGPVPLGGNVHVTIHFDDVPAFTRAFEALSADGEVTMAIHDTFFGTKLGTLVDPFGVQWMLHCELGKS